MNIFITAKELLTQDADKIEESEEERDRDEEDNNTSVGSMNSEETEK